MSNDSSSAVESFDFLEPAGQPEELGRLGPYRVLELLGAGGMGCVFRAEDTRLRRLVALKVMKKRLAAAPGSRKRFLNEARAMAAVGHDNVATIYEVGERNGTPFLAMELLKGSTLDALLNAGETFHTTRTVNLAIGICHGLQAAHDQGLVHRDVQPSNIWIESPSGRPKLLDFGLALATRPVEQIAGAGSVTGTPGYLSPEQARVEPLDNRSDLYNLGVVLFEICTGKLPFVVKPAQRMLIAVIADPPPVVHELNPSIPQPLSDLIGRLLSKEARDRPASANALAKLLEESGQPSGEAATDVTLIEKTAKE